MRKIFLTILASIITLFSFSQANLRTKHFNLEKGLAIQGYDAVAYFTANKAIKGNKQFTTTYEGATYYFSSAANRDLFIKTPKSYEPQYGGWCAYAMGATNEKVEIDPETFKIKDGKLFLFYHSWINNTLTKWNKDETSLYSKAEANWKVIFK
ncbi:MAG: YHS domain-containing (seleno)protein [Chitinophagaceae bacterium]